LVEIRYLAGLFEDKDAKGTRSSRDSWNPSRNAPKALRKPTNITFVVVEKYQAWVDVALFVLTVVFSLMIPIMLVRHGWAATLITIQCTAHGYTGHR
jgi:hypothetical protein